MGEELAKPLWVQRERVVTQVEVLDRLAVLGDDLHCACQVLSVDVDVLKVELAEV